MNEVSNSIFIIKTNKKSGDRKEVKEKRWKKNKRKEVKERRDMKERQEKLPENSG
jgi:hypothetical protein